ncbi:hypothetical protein IAG41_02900 [Sphingomonas sp. JC676]|uniref:hypothetical protein n=1 Tax=Sphingomonas sp. JC676 TaxID=2768065 RepID=UPI001657D9AE|nr:hypothetical protein [Sphingomonas sp. JC676]MBC9031330.1 hypothetical protein [Sphingomonas sp. JC676]
MGMFEYVVVLTGVVIGLALTHLMQGVARIIEQPDRVRVWWVHLGWVGYMFVNAVFWWWWEFRLRLIVSWSFQLYAFVLGYAFLVYLICAVLFPSDVAAFRGYKEYFIARRRWFFGMLIAWLAIDLLDTWAKGSTYFASLGIEYPIAQAGLALVCLLGFLSPRERVQILVLLLVIAYQASRIVRFFDVVQ